MIQLIFFRSYSPATNGKSLFTGNRFPCIFMPMKPVLLLFLVATCTRLWAQDQSIFPPDSVKRQFQARAITGNLKVDGKLDEPEWQLAPPSPRFVMIEPHQGEQPHFETDVRILYNKQYLYIGVFCQDSLGKKAIRATDFKRDFNNRQHDHISMVFDGFNDHRNAMAFVSNAYGVQRDLLSFDDLYYDVDWDGLWRVRTQLTDSGWYAEVAIPWQTFRYKKADTAENYHWGFNIYRNRRLTNEITAFSPYPRSVSILRMAYAGELAGIKPPPPKPNIRIQPYLLTAYDAYHNYDPGTKPEQTNMKLGGDLKWAVNPNAVLDLTVNTDFAQADADRQVNNLTRFSVFFPERRQFFLENASLFGVGVGPSEDLSGGNMRIRPFFSRKIGLDDSGNPIPIDAGGRFVYRSLKRNFGAMAIRQREYKGSPGTNFFVGRYAENFGAQSRLGALVTMKNTPAGTNLVSSVDGFFRLGNYHSVNTMITQSYNSATGKTGWAGYAQYYYANNQWKLWWTQTLVTSQYDPQLGFISRGDVVGTTPGVFWYYRGNKLPMKKLIRAFEPGVMTEFYHQASTGTLIERQLMINPIWFNFQKGGFFGYIVTPVYQRLTENFEPLGITILPGTFHYTRHQFYWSSDPSRILSYSLNYETGSYFDGKLRTVDFRLQFAPIPHVSLVGRAVRNHFINVGTPATTKTTDLYSVEGRFALNPRIQLVGFYQWNSENKQTNTNIRLSWEYQPLSYIYFVYNHRGFDNTAAKRQTDDHVIAKISYLRQL